MLRTVGARAARELDALRGFDDECVGFVATRLRRAVLSPGEVVYAPGRAADEMYFVAHGAVRLILSTTIYEIQYLLGECLSL